MATWFFKDVHHKVLSGSHLTCSLLLQSNFLPLPFSLLKKRKYPPRIPVSEILPWAVSSPALGADPSESSAFLPGPSFLVSKTKFKPQCLVSYAFSRLPPDSDINPCSRSFLDCLSYVLERSIQPTVSLGGSAWRATGHCCPALSMIPARIKADGCAHPSSSILFLTNPGS